MHGARGLALPSMTMGGGPVLSLSHLSEVTNGLMETQLHGWHFALFSRMPGNAALTVGVQQCFLGLPLKPDKLDMAGPTAGVPPAALQPLR